MEILNILSLNGRKFELLSTKEKKKGAFVKFIIKSLFIDDEYKISKFLLGNNSIEKLTNKLMKIKMDIPPIIFPNKELYSFSPLNLSLYSEEYMSRLLIK